MLSGRVVKSDVNYCLYQREILHLGCLYSELNAVMLDQCALESIACTV